MIHLIGWILILIPAVTIVCSIVAIVFMITRDALAGDPDAQMLAIALWGLILFLGMVIGGAYLISL